MMQLRAVTIYRYNVSIRTWPIPYRYAWVPYRVVKNLVISNLKNIYSGTFYSYSVNVCYLKQDQMDK